MGQIKEKRFTTNKSCDNEFPRDRGWAWLVMIGSFVVHIFYFIFSRSLSIFFIEFLETFKQSATITTLAFGLLTLALGISSILLPPLMLPRFSARTISLTGEAIMVSAMIGMAFANNIIHLTAMLILIGVANPLLFIPQMVLLGEYFNQRLTFAVAFANLGQSVALLCGPTLTQFLLDTYGLQGTLLLHGALNLHGIAACLLFRPPSFYNTTQKSNPLIEKSNIDRPYEYDDNKMDETMDIYQKEWVAEEKDVTLKNYSTNDCDVTSTRIGRHDVNIELGPIHNSHDLNVKYYDSSNEDTLTLLIKNDNVRIQTHATDQQSDSQHLINSSTDNSTEPTYYTSYNKIPNSHFNSESNLSFKTKDPKTNVEEVNDFSHPFQKESNKQGVSEKYDLRTKSKHALSDSNVNNSNTDQSNSDASKSKRNILCNPSVILLSMIVGLGQNANCMMTYIPSLGKENGLTKSQLPLLMTIIGIADLFKIIVGHFADKGWIPQIYIAFIHCILFGTLLQFAAVFENFISMVIFCIIIGANAMILHILLPGMVTEILGKDYIGPVTSGYFIWNGINMTVTHIGIGYLKDSTGSFVGAYHLTGGLVLLTALLILLEIFLRKMKSRRNSNPSEKSEITPDIS